MLWRSTCYVLAAAFVASGPLGGAKAQDVDAEAFAEATSGSSYPECSCGCCQVTSRTASQQVSGTSNACAMLPHLPVTADSEGYIQTERFCMLNCLPEEQEVGSKCRVVTTEEQAAIMTEGGNGRDPAALAAPVTTALPAELKDPDAPPEPPELSDAAALAEAEDTKAAEAAEAAAKTAASSVKGKDEKKEKETGALVAQASGKQAIAAGIEARIQEAEAGSSQALSLTTGDLDSAKTASMVIASAKAQVAAASVEAKIYADSAKKAAARAQVELKEIEAMPAKAAALAAVEAKSVIQSELNEAASTLATIKASRAPPPLPMPLAEAAVKAAQPYYAIMQKAIGIGNLYEQSAHSLQDQAQTLQEQSRKLASQAVLYQTAGYGDMASKLMAQAKSMLTESEAKDAQAKKDFAVAENVRKTVPAYQANAAAASARATTLANPAGQPPPAQAFLQRVARSKARQ